MHEVLLTNIFFAITARASIVITVGVSAVLWHLVPLVRDARDIMRRLRNAGEKVEKDFDDLRASVREEGAKGKLLVDLGLGYVSRKFRVRRTKPKAEDITQ